ncbi:Integral membrane protein TerC [Pirellula staleyi DSM 6068]|uniref:Integral membrane protein TerC n=1 Tax=Pirellula staleyi (strain ATCC 27377 / DSM 6068 / ICPB 4128) TaxID=530564 RepID=D2QWM5_PIRSD|nr:TerC family protein [Pirellula staleyi]ADB17828.1 Integral membrane protein TerC [Pirellula staleyi DSM 6068]
MLNALMTEFVALFALTAMEIVLGIDNIVFISVASARLPLEQQARARWIGLLAAMGTRLLLLLCISWIMGLTVAAFQWDQILPASWIDAMKSKPTAQVVSGEPGTVPATTDAATEEKHADEEHKHSAHDEEAFQEFNVVSWKDLILLFGGLFLIRSSVIEIHHKMEGAHADPKAKGRATFGQVIFQIAMLDIIFSLDSVITAVGMAESIYVMMTAVVIAVGVMMIFAGTISEFVERHPTVKMLALSFLLLIGVMLVAEGAGTHINKGYIYFAMAFSLGVEILNLRMKAAAARKLAAAEKSH